MFRVTNFLATVLTISAIATASTAKDTKVVITVEGSKQVSVETEKPPFAGKRSSVDVAILLDSSNSMDGLINQAKHQLWTIVGQFAKAKKNGQTPVPPSAKISSSKHVGVSRQNLAEKPSATPS